MLAIEAETGELLVLMDQLLHHRDEVPDEETLTEHRERKTRESLLWVRGTEHGQGEGERLRMLHLAYETSGRIDARCDSTFQLGTLEP